MEPLNISESKTAQDEYIKLTFNLKNAKKDCLYSLNLRNPDKDFDDNSLVVESKKCSDSDNIFFFEYNYEYYFGKEQNLNIKLTKKDSNSLKTFTFDIIIAEVIGSQNRTKCYCINGNNEEILEVKDEKREKKAEFLIFLFVLKVESNETETIPIKLKE